MLDSPISETIRQKKMDCLATKHLHIWRRIQLNKYSQLVDALGLAVPAIYFAFRYLAKGTNFEKRVESIWEVLAALLLVSTILKIVYKWQEKAQEHSKLMGENISLAGQADNLLMETAQAESAQMFLVLARKLETEDRDVLGSPSVEKKQAAYREALKEVHPGNALTVCPVCKSSPWKFVPGSCQACGNTPSQ